MDGHTDYMWPELSGTKWAAGMDLAIVTGHCHPKLSGINGFGPYVKEENVYCVGNREYDEQYVKTIEDSNMQYYDRKTLRRKGVERCSQAFLGMVAKNNLDGFWIHLDLDVLDDELMPAVDSRSPDGLSYEVLKEMLIPLLNSTKSVGIEITILDPDPDPEGICTTAFVNEIGLLLAEKISERL